MRPFHGHRRLLISLWILSSACSVGQTLYKEQSIVAPDIGEITFMPVHCDSSGNVYLQPPLSKITMEGKRSAVFDISAARADGLTDLMPKSAFGVGDDGKVYVLARARSNRPIIVRFDNDGRYSGSLILDQQFDPQQLVVFANGTFLVSGGYVETEGSPPIMAPFVGLFDSSGQLLRRVDNAEHGSDHSAKRAQEKSKAPSPSASLELGIMESDGTDAYLLRQGEEPEVFVISSAGVLTRHFRLLPPRPHALPARQAGTYLQAGALRVHAGEMLVEYIEPKGLPNGNTAYHMVVYEAGGGHMLREYRRNSDVTGSLACTDWKGRFSFLSSGNSGPALLIAALH
jgi:hypothetical protein